MEYLMLAIGLFVWWLYYGLECYLNGTLNGGSLMPFVCWFEELSWNTPVTGWRARLEFTCGDADWARKLPGLGHFIPVCVLLPLGPWLIWRAWGWIAGGQSS